MEVSICCKSEARFKQIGNSFFKKKNRVIEKKRKTARGDKLIHFACDRVRVEGCEETRSQQRNRGDEIKSEGR